MRATVLLRAALFGEHRRAVDTIERLDAAVGSLSRDFAATELARDERGTLLALPDVASAARFALALRDSFEDKATAAFAIELGVERLLVEAGRPPRASGPGLVAVDELADLALGGQILAGPEITATLAGVADIGVASLGVVTLGAGESEIFEIERADSLAFAIPRRRGAFVGREAELARAVGSVDGGERFLTVVGPVGVGKTRFVLELLARRFSMARRAFVDLTMAKDGDDAAHRVAAVLEVRLPDGERGEALHRALAALVGRAVDVLVLDGLDCDGGATRPPYPRGTRAPTQSSGALGPLSLRSGVDAAAVAVVRAIVAAPGPVVVVTGREPFGEGSDACIRLEPLTPEETRELLARRCEEAGSLAVLEDDPSSLSQVTAVLDGLPLAVEIAAGLYAERPRSDVLEARTAGVVAESDPLTRLDRALEAALSRAHRSLSDHEREVLGVLCAMPSGLAADCVEEDARVAVERLRRKSLLVEEGLPSRRVRALSCVRRFVARTLSPPDAARCADVAARALLVFAERWAKGARGRTPAPCLTRLAEELDNLRALHEELSSSSPELAVRCALALDELLSARGPRDLHLGLLASAARTAARCSPTLETDVRLARATALASVYGDPSAALEELAPLDPLHTDGVRGATRRWIEGVCAFAAARYGEAETALSAARLAFASLGDAAGEARSANSLGNVHAHEGRLDEGARCYEAAIACYARIGDSRGTAVVVQNLARLARERGDRERAALLHEEALAISRELGDRRVEGMAWAQSALAAHDRGDLADAERRYDTAIALFVQTGEWRFRGWAQVHAAFCSMERGDLERARRLLVECAPRDPVTEALRSAASAVVAALSDELAGAKTAFAAASSVSDPLARAAVAVLEGVLDAALARHARHDGRDADAVAHTSAARSRWAKAATANPPALPAADQSALVRIAIRLVADALGDRRAEPISQHVLEMAQDASWFRPPGEPRIDLSRRIPLRRLLSFLVQRRLERPSAPASPAELVASIWPDESIEKRAAMNRLYVAVATLRKAGAGELLIRRQDGYLLDPNIPVVLRPAPTSDR